MRNLTFSEYPFYFDFHKALTKQVNKEAEVMIKDRQVPAPKPFKVEKREWKVDLTKIMWSWMP